jgi:[acyl-carrier-protein] S-malonyltransferase
VWSNVTGLRHGTPDEIRELLSRQVIEPVQWESLMLSILALPVDTFYEIGPGKVLSGLLKRINRKATCQAITA